PKGVISIAAVCNRQVNLRDNNVHGGIEEVVATGPAEVHFHGGVELDGVEYVEEAVVSGAAVKVDVESRGEVWQQGVGLGWRCVHIAHSHAERIVATAAAHVPRPRVASLGRAA